MNSHAALQPDPEIPLVVEPAGIRLSRPGSQMILGYPEAAVWEMAARGYDLARIVDSLQHIIGVEQIVMDTFQILSERGFGKKETDG
jgi:hypothetical protein